MRSRTGYVEIDGLPELLKKLNDPTYIQTPTGRYLDRLRFFTQRRAVSNINRGKGGWLFTGNTRQSIASERDSAMPPMWAKVGSNLMKARWGEYGTGKLSDDPDSKKRAYFPPPGKLQQWAIKRGFKDRPGHETNIWKTAGGTVSRIIHQQGGTKPRMFLRTAMAESIFQLPKYLTQMAREIEKEAERGVK